MALRGAECRVRPGRDRIRSARYERLLRSARRSRDTDFERRAARRVRRYCRVPAGRRANHFNAALPAVEIGGATIRGYRPTDDQLRCSSSVNLKGRWCSSCGSGSVALAPADGQRDRRWLWPAGPRGAPLDCGRCSLRVARSSSAETWCAGGDERIAVLAAEDVDWHQRFAVVRKGESGRCVTAAFLARLGKVLARSGRSILLIRVGNDRYFERNCVGELVRSSGVESHADDQDAVDRARQGTAWRAGGREPGRGPGRVRRSPSGHVPAFCLHKHKCPWDDFRGSVPYLCPNKQGHGSVYECRRSMLRGPSVPQRRRMPKQADRCKPKCRRCVT